MGATLIDISAFCGAPAGEELVGQALAPFRGKAVLAAKCGEPCGGNPAAIRKAVENLLRQLHTDYLDLYYCQPQAGPDAPIEEAADTMSRLIREGKLLHWGLSDAGVDTIRRANAVFPVTAVQCEYSLWRREAEKELLPALEGLGIGFVPAGSLGRGFSVCGRRFIWAMEAFAAQRALSPAQVALAWLLRQKPWIVPATGAGNTVHLQENLSAAYVNLGDSDLEELEWILAGTPNCGGAVRNEDTEK